MPDTDDTSWDTHEVYSWLSNDEGAYWEARRCRSAQQMRELFSDLAIPNVDWSEVDWDHIFDLFGEDE